MGGRGRVRRPDVTEAVAERGTLAKLARLVPNYLTPEGAKKLSDELDQLLRVQRPKVVQEVAEAAAQGDRSENAEYIYGKKRLREIDRRVRFLTKRLESAVVVKPGEVGGDRVRFGAKVELRDENGKSAATPSSDLTKPIPRRENSAFSRPSVKRS
ncbi:MAG: hypothetical protein QM784_04310 [Polyangiaceae bacterium]